MSTKREVSFFNKINATPRPVDLLKIMKSIHQGQFKKDKILEIRDSREQGKDYSQLKRELSGFTPCGTFNGSRRGVDLSKYSKMIVLDIDNIGMRKLNDVKRKAIKDEFTFAVFTSPSGTGLKILVKVDSDVSLHKVAFERVKEYYETLLDVEIDRSGKDVTRLCFVSYDPDLYLNEDSLEFQILKLVESKFAKAIKLTNDSFEFKKGQRNNFIYTLACYCNQLSMPRELALKFIIRDYKYDDGKELKSSVKSAYSRALTPIEGSLKTADPIEEYLLGKYEFRFNIVKGVVEVRDKGQSSYERITDRKIHSILRDLKNNKMATTKSKLVELLESDFTPEYHPIKEYLNSLPEWDGETDHIDELSKKVITDDNAFFKDVFKRWFVAMIACALEPEVTNQTAIIFSGGQGIGKSTFIRKLLPPELSDYMYSGMIDPKSKDSLTLLAETFIIDLDELSNLTNKGNNEIKELITKAGVKVRRPYGRITEDLPRRASFIGSVNDRFFLTDTTGNRRYLCFIVQRIDYTSPINYEGIYAQASALIQQGFRYYFNESDNVHINHRNEKFRHKDILEEILISTFKPAYDKNNANYYFTASELLKQLGILYSIDFDERNNVKLGKLLNKLGYDKIKSGGRYVYAMDLCNSYVPGDESGQFPFRAA